MTCSQSHTLWSLVDNSFICEDIGGELPADGTQEVTLSSDPSPEVETRGQCLGGRRRPLGRSFKRVSSL